MIMELIALGSLSAAGYYAYKHYGSATVLAAVKNEIAKVEAEVKAEYSTILPAAKADVTKVIAAIKAQL